MKKILGEIVLLFSKVITEGQSVEEKIAKLDELNIKEMKLQMIDHDGNVHLVDIYHWNVNIEEIIDDK